MAKKAAAKKPAAKKAAAPKKADAKKTPAPKPAPAVAPAPKQEPAPAPAAKEPAPAPKEPVAAPKPKAAAKAPAKDTLFKELSKAAGLEKPDEGEDRGKFFDRFINKLNELSDDAFSKLSKEAREWFNHACDMHKEGKLAELKLDGDPFNAPAEQVEEVSTAAEGAAPAEEAAPPAAAEKPARKARAAAAPKPEKDDASRRNNSITQHIRIEICKDPKQTDEDLVKKLGVRGHKAVDQAYVAGVAHRTRQVLEVKARVDTGELS